MLPVHHLGHSFRGDFKHYDVNLFGYPWTPLQGHEQMRMNVQVYDSANHNLGYDQQYVTLLGGGGGKLGGDPVPE